MTLPSFVRFIGPLLEYLGEQRVPIRPKTAYADLAERLSLPEADRRALLPSGQQLVFHNRTGWAHDALKRAGLSSAPVRGSWLITDAGRKLLDAHDGKLPDDEIERIGSVARDVSVQSLAGASGAQSSVDPAALAEAARDARSPREQIELALAQIRASVGHDLLEHIERQTPADFESLVLDVL